MGAPEVDYVLSAVEGNLTGANNTLASLSLERIDRDNNNNLDGEWTHQHSADPEKTNFVSAALVSRPQEPMGTEYDLRGDAVVSVQVMGMAATADTFGAIDPGNGVQPAAVDWNTTGWDALTDNIRRAILAGREFPAVGRANTSYKGLFIENWNDNSQAYSDWYMLSFDVRFSGFETLP